MSPEYAQITRLLKIGNVEIRAFDSNKKTWIGVFNDVEKIIESIKMCIKEKMSVYNTINPTLRPVTNVVAHSMNATSDSDIKKITWIPFDIDVSAKDKMKGANKEQIDSASDLTDSIIDFLESHGWYNPIIGFSGNGYHLLYRVDIENTPELKNILKVIYTELHKRFSNEHASFDRTVRNPARILRTYGSINQKGGRKTWCSNEFSILEKKSVYALFKALKPPPIRRHWVKPENKNNGISTDGWDSLKAVSQAGLYLSSPENDKHYITCPWSDLHSSTGDKDTVLWTDNKYGTFHCSHDHCSGRTIKDLKNVL